MGEMMSARGLALAERIQWIVDQVGEGQRPFSRRAFGEKGSTKIGSTLATLRSDQTETVKHEYLTQLCRAAHELGVMVRLDWLSNGVEPRLMPSSVPERSVDYDRAPPNPVVAVALADAVASGAYTPEQIEAARVRMGVFSGNPSREDVQDALRAAVLGAEEFRINAEEQRKLVDRLRKKPRPTEN